MRLTLLPEMRPDYRKILEPHSKAFEDMAVYVRECSDGELDELLDACIDASPSNCAWSIYRAAQNLKQEAQMEKNQRLRRASEQKERRDG